LSNGNILFIYEEDIPIVLVDLADVSNSYELGIGKVLVYFHINSIDPDVMPEFRKKIRCVSCKRVD